ncbi:MAG: hypothetical protein ABI707_03750 [Ferruginibacter sp.]
MKESKGAVLQLRGPAGWGGESDEFERANPFKIESKEIQIRKENFFRTRRSYKIKGVLADTTYSQQLGNLEYIFSKV